MSIPWACVTAEAVLQLSDVFARGYFVVRSAIGLRPVRAKDA